MAKQEFNSKHKINFLQLILEAPKGFQHSLLLNSPQEGRVNVLQVQVVNLQIFNKIISLMFKVLTSGTFLKGVIFNYKPFHKKMFQVGNQLYIKGKIEKGRKGYYRFWDGKSRFKTSPTYNR